MPQRSGNRVYWNYAALPSGRSMGSNRNLSIVDHTASLLSAHPDVQNTLTTMAQQRGPRTAGVE
jgi:hypothetical protein